MSTWRAVQVLMLCAALAVLASVPGTTASLADEVTMQQVSVTAGSVQAPTALAVTRIAGDANRVSWSAPASGLSPAQYEVFRRPTSGSYGPTPIATVGASPWDDTTAAECTSYTYRARSRHTNLVSSFTAEQTLTYDETAPVISEARLISTSGPEPVPDYVRNGGEFYVYAKVDDACADAGDLTVQWTLGAMTHGSWTPIGGGPTYNFRAGPLNAGNAAHGTFLDWFGVAATDPSGNTSSTFFPITWDNQPPAVSRASVVVAQLTNYYAPGELGRVRPGAPYLAYMSVDDADVGMPATQGAYFALSPLTTGADAIELTPGSYATDNGESWNYRTGVGAFTAGAGLAEGTVNTITAFQDKLGNVGFEAVSIVVDDTRPVLSSCTSTDVLGAGQLRNGDYTTFGFSEAITPSTFDPAWTDGSATRQVPASVQHGGPGTDDFIELGAFGLLRGASSPNDAFDLNHSNWIGSGSVAMETSTFTRESGSQFRMTWNSASSFNLTRRRDTGVVHLGNGIRDAAGNSIAANSSVNCGTTF